MGFDSIPRDVPEPPKTHCRSSLERIRDAAFRTPPGRDVLPPGVDAMSLDSVRAAYPILVQLARDLSQVARDRRAAVWVSYDDFCQRCKEVGVKETPRTIATKLLKPLQAACLEHNLPDLSALIIQKPKARSNFGNLIRLSDGWWEAYVARGEATAGDVQFWFKQFQTARDYADWPEVPPF